MPKPIVWVTSVRIRFVEEGINQGEFEFMRCSSIIDSKEGWDMENVHSLSRY